MTSAPKKERNDGALKTTTGTPLQAPDSPAAQEAKKAKDGTATPTDEDKPAAGTGTGTGAPTGTGTGTGADKPGTDVPLPTPRPDVPATTDPLAGVGPKCTKLWECCANLRAAGITGSANQCDTSALGNDEVTCDVANEVYKTPDDNYDPVCF